MKGTEKQIKWANDIIDTARAQLDLLDKATHRQILDKGQEETDAINGFTASDVAAVRADFEAFLLRPELTASWMIDRRTMFSGEAMIQRVRAYHKAHA